jgi:hypothetical protein
MGGNDSFLPEKGKNYWISSIPLVQSFDLFLLLRKKLFIFVADNLREVISPLITLTPKKG